jgi:MOSC domain-containing protein YiiM
MGSVESIHIAPKGGAPMQAVERVHAIPGVGLEGDRYAESTGHWSDDPRTTGRDLTLIEAEVVDGLRTELGIELEPGQARRNVSTRGIRLNDLVGRRFLVGSVLCEGVRLCEPCEYLTNLVAEPVLRPLAHKGGLRARILTDGYMAVGDVVRDVASPVEIGGEQHPPH